MTTLEERIGYIFRDPRLLRLALTHPSVSTRENNQRLEFLGDAVLQYLMSEKLYRTHPQAREGELTRMRASLVCEETLSGIARRLNLGAALLTDKGEEQDGGRSKPSVLCDTMEALLAAVCLDGGLAEARRIVETFWPEPEEVHLTQNAKGELQELLQAEGGGLPTYEIIGQRGPDNAPVFEAEVYRDGQPLATGLGHKKRDAEQAAAAEALRRLREQRGPGTEPHA